MALGRRGPQLRYRRAQVPDFSHANWDSVKTAGLSVPTVTLSRTGQPTRQGNYPE